MGRSPAGPADPTWPDGTADTEDRNGLDFWWDQFLGNARNCWYDNDGPEADGSGLTSLPAAPLLPGEGLIATARPASAPAAPVQEEELVDCLGNFEFGTPGPAPGSPRRPSRVDPVAAVARSGSTRCEARP